jgi:hypothetical protein
MRVYKQPHSVLRLESTNKIDARLPFRAGSARWELFWNAVANKTTRYIERDVIRDRLRDVFQGIR